MPWLVAALGKVKAGNPQASALIAAAGKIDSHFATPQLRLPSIRCAWRWKRGKLDQARAQLDQVLVKQKGRLPASSLNHFLSLRMQLAKI